MKLVETIANLQSNADVLARKRFSMRPKMLFPLTFDIAWVKAAIKTDAHKKQTVSIQYHQTGCLCTIFNFSLIFDYDNEGGLKFYTQFRRAVSSSV